MKGPFTLLVMSVTTFSKMSYSCSVFLHINMVNSYSERSQNNFLIKKQDENVHRYSREKEREIYFIASHFLGLFLLYLVVHPLS